LFCAVLGFATTASAFKPLPPQSPTPRPAPSPREIGSETRIPICDLNELPDNVADLACDYLDGSWSLGCNINIATKTASPPAPTRAPYGLVIFSKNGEEADPAEPFSMSWGTAELLHTSRVRCTVGAGDGASNTNSAFFGSTYMPPGETLVATASDRNQYPIARNANAIFLFSGNYPMEFAIQVFDSPSGSWKDLAVQRSAPGRDDNTVRLQASIPGFAITRIAVRTPPGTSGYWLFFLRYAAMFIQGCDDAEDVCFPQ
jgi:hypothetical protein